MVVFVVIVTVVAIVFVTVTVVVFILIFVNIRPEVSSVRIIPRRHCILPLQLEGTKVGFSLIALYMKRKYSPLRGLTSSTCRGLRLSLLFGQKRASDAVCAYVRPFLVFSSVQ